MTVQNDNFAADFGCDDLPLCLLGSGSGHKCQKITSKIEILQKQKSMKGTQEHIIYC